MADTGNSIIRLSGRFDFTCFKHFQSQYEPLLTDVGIKTIDVNFSAVQFLDSAALGMLMLLREKAANMEKTIRLAQVNAALRSIMEEANLPHFFEFI